MKQHSSVKSRPGNTSATRSRRPLIGAFRSPMRATNSNGSIHHFHRDGVLAFETISCDRLHREKPLQCGYCSSCFLRRQALAMHRVEDRTGYIATTCPVERQVPWQLSLPLKPLKEVATTCTAKSQASLEIRPKHFHLAAMLRQIEDLRVLLSASSPWCSLVLKYPRRADVVDQIAPSRGLAPDVMQEHLIQLYQTYVCEWDNSVRGSLGEGLLDS